MSICNFPDLKGVQQAFRTNHETGILIKLPCTHSDAVYLTFHWHKLLLEIMQSTDLWNVVLIHIRERSETWWKLEEREIRPTWSSFQIKCQYWNILRVVLQCFVSYMLPSLPLKVCPCSVMSHWFSFSSIPFY